MDTVQRSAKPTATSLRIEGSNDLFIWKKGSDWFQVVPMVEVIATPTDVGGIENLINSLVAPHLFDPGPWPDGWMGFSNADERVYFDCRGAGMGSEIEPYTVWAIVGKDANELGSGVIHLGPNDLPEIVRQITERADQYFSKGYTPVSTDADFSDSTTGGTR